MLTFEAGKAVTLPVNFIMNGQPAIPDQGSAVLSVSGPDGTELYTENLVTGPTDLRVYVTVPAEHNQIATSFARRLVTITALRGGASFTVSEPYRLVPAIQYTVRPQDVRDFLGVNTNELPDGSIDLAQSLLDLEFATSRAMMSAALTSGEQAELRANEAILYHAALKVIPGLSNRVAMEESDGALSFRRNARKDFSDLQKVAQGRLSDALAVINPTAVDPGFPLMITTTDADPFTG
ncbi:hypothetical protein [Mesorhizobium sp. WSM2239]|uniref:Phage tail protein n=2 Tax=unclassified Mesorhizobium TaxID=325217 RepID=A0AAU8DGT2_9HYPH